MKLLGTDNGILDLCTPNIDLESATSLTFST
jgi:hypothetical protein